MRSMPTRYAASLKITVPVTPDAVNLSSKFVCCMIFRFRVNSGDRGSDLRTDGRGVTRNAAS